MGVQWDFAPVVAVVQDTRWGRTYESFAENTELVTQLGEAYVRGLQSVDGTTNLGITRWRCWRRPSIISAMVARRGDQHCRIFLIIRIMLDQGDTRVDEATLRDRLYLPPYKAAVEAGALSVMPSFSSWNGTKMHGNKYLLTDVLKDELGFDGFLISDWDAISQLPGDAYESGGEGRSTPGSICTWAPKWQRFLRAIAAGGQAAAMCPCRASTML